MIGTYMYENGKQWSPSSHKLKQTLLEKFGVQKGASNQSITHTDLSGGTTLRNGTYGPGNCSCRTRTVWSFCRSWRVA